VSKQLAQSCYPVVGGMAGMQTHDLRVNHSMYVTEPRILN